MKLLIGCPISRRDWIILDWRVAVEKAVARAGITDFAYLFVANPMDLTVDVIQDGFPAEQLSWVWVEDDDRERSWDDERFRDWGPSRLQYMVDLRNKLLGAVRTKSPELFLSLDSDVLLHPEALAGMIEGISTYHAVGARCYMTVGDTNFPSYAMHSNGTFVRKDFDYGPTPVDVIMAVKLMTPLAYGIDYQYHAYGEDAGWGLACKEAGLKLAWDGRYISKHVMTKDRLYAADRRYDW